MGDVEIRIKVDGESYAFGLRKLRSRWQLERLCALIMFWYKRKVEDQGVVREAERIISTTGKPLPPGDNIKEEER